MADRLLFVLPSVLKEVDSEIMIDDDFCENIRVCLETFATVSVASPVSIEVADSGLRRCRRLEDLLWRDRVNVIALPYAYGLGRFLLSYRDVKRVLKEEIDKADYLIFSPHTLVGDWPMVAASEAIRSGRRYIIEADVVYDKVAIVNSSREKLWKKIVKQNITLPLFRRDHRRCLKNSSLSLLQGQDVYDAYAKFCPNPYKVYHTPVSSNDYITTDQLSSKLNDLDESRPLRICYVGRAMDMKGPSEWLMTLHDLIQKGVRIDASWLGDGSLLASMKEQVKALNIEAFVKLPGYVENRTEILQALRRADLFLFCHKTPESPRCLVEALASGCPLVGYESGYPKELVAECGGGEFVNLSDWRALANLVKKLNDDRAALGKLIRSAAASGRLYERDATMRYRINLIKQHLRPNNSPLEERDYADVRS
jgi:glycosyltransferase involved in cell wall biosynthesis